MSRVTVIVAMLVVYLGIMFLVGLRGKKFSESNSGMMTAAGQGTLIMVTGSYLGSHLGNGVVVGGAQYGALYGIGGFWYGAGAAASYLLFGLVMSKAIYKKKYITVPDILKDAYVDKITVALIAVLSAAGQIAVAAGQITAGKLLFEYLGLNGTVGAFLTTAIVVIYSGMSGLWGVMMTDVIQSSVIFVVCILGTIWLVANGGFTVMKENLPASYYDFVPFDAETLIMMCGPGALNGLISAAGFQRTTSCKNEKTAVAAPYLGALLVVAFAILPVFFGMYGLALTPDAPANTIMFKVLLEDFPPIMGGLLVCAIAAAVMSTADGCFLAASANVVNDVYMKLIDPEGKASEQKLANITRVATYAVGLITTLIALGGNMLIPMLSLSYSLVNAGALVMALGGVFWKKANKYGAWASFIAGEGTFALIKLGVIAPPAASIFPVLPSLIAFVIVCLATQNKDHNHAIA